jgi:hypothetical protein
MVKTMPDPEARLEVVDTIKAHPEAELVDFTRDVYRTLFVRVDSKTARDEVIELGTEAGYNVWDRPAAAQLVFEAPSGASRKVRMGGNRL